ncbi:MAG: cytochrome b N-terminal domain-containing protein [Chloroflexota bacterium]|nr:cytochrome b N-terminal domain-containing protein [Chloroflexota bacterium]
MRGLWRWIDERLELEDSVFAVLRHPVPREVDTGVGWFYVFGSVTLTLFIVQVVTGVALAMTYVPAPNSAYDSLKFITDQAFLGSFVRGVHYWGAAAMVIVVLVHMTQVFFFGAHRYPRELNWMTGSLLLLSTLAMAFSGQLLRWDQDAYWAVVVAAEQVARVPVIGDILAHVVVAGSDVGGATLTRFFATHVFLIPALIFGFIGVHLYLVIKRGISEPPTPGQRVERATYRQRYEEALAHGVPFYPDVIWRDVVAAFAAVAVVVALAIVVGPAHLGQPPDPTVILADPRPDWYFLGYFALLALIPPATETIVIVGLPVLAFAFLFLLPLWRPFGERHWSRRPGAVAVVTIPLVAYIALSVAGEQAPWSPELAQNASLPPAVTAGLDAAQRHGAELFVSKGCWSCHQIAGSGGRRGPDLSTIASRDSRSRIIQRILNGGVGATDPGEGFVMPAYASTISPADLNDLVDFLETRK